MTARATSSYQPLLEAMNAGRLPRLADGGRVGPVRATQLPSLAGRGDPTGGLVRLQVSLPDDLDARIDNRAAGVAVEVVRQSAPALVDASRSATLADLQRPRL